MSSLNLIGLNLIGLNLIGLFAKERGKRELEK